MLVKLSVGQIQTPQPQIRSSKQPRWGGTLKYGRQQENKVFIPTFFEYTTQCMLGLVPVVLGH